MKGPRGPSAQNLTADTEGAPAPLHPNAQLLWGAPPTSTTELTGHSPASPLTEEPAHQGLESEQQTSRSFSPSRSRSLPTVRSVTGPSWAESSFISPEGGSVRLGTWVASAEQHRTPQRRGLHCPGKSEEATRRGGLGTGGRKHFRQEESCVQYLSR